MSTVKHNVQAGYYIAAKRSGKKSHGFHHCAGKKVVVYCNSFYILFFTAHVRDIKIPNWRQVEIERRVSKIDAPGCIQTPSGIDHI